CDPLDERRLAGAVVADEGDDLAAMDLEVDVEERLDRAEALGHAGGAEQRRAGGGGRSREGRRVRERWGCRGCHEPIPFGWDAIVHLPVSAPADAPTSGQFPTEPADFHRRADAE